MSELERRRIKKELRQAGASATEISELLPIAMRLKRLAGGKPSHGKVFKPLFAAVAGAAIALILLFTSHAVLPGSPLYPVQKFTDNVAEDIHPQYRGNVMMKRAHQVNELVAKHAGSQQILSTLADYNREAKRYQAMPHANYAAFEYCESNLKQAAANAPAGVRQEILNSLQSLESS